MANKFKKIYSVGNTYQFDAGRNFTILANKPYGFEVEDFDTFEEAVEASGKYDSPTIIERWVKE